MRTKNNLVLALLTTGAVALLLLAVGIARADAPTKINYQGRLTDPNDVPVPDGNYPITFTIYDALSGGNVKWTETQMVPVIDGIFSILLGNVTPLQPSIFNGDCWLGLKVGTDTEMMPRQQIVSVAYALRTQNAINADYAANAGDADTLDDHDSSYFAIAAHNHDARYYTESESDSRFVNDNAGEVGNADVPVGAFSPDKISGTAWTSTNDGTGSGLDADKLDGSHASAFAPATHDHWGEIWEGSGTGLTLQNGTIGLDSYGTDRGVWGTGGNFGVVGTSGGTGVYGHTTSGKGVYGVASASSGSNWGVYGTSNSTSGMGVIGLAEATSGQTYGVFGASSSTSGRGVMGLAEAFSGTTYGVYGATNSPDGYGVYFQGGLGGTGTKSAIVQTSSYGQRKLYTLESPEVWFEDFGTAQLVEGRATVSIEPIFGETVNLEAGYHVFLTPNGDCNGLYVTNKTETSFEVRELKDGSSSIAFDYRIVAKRLGYEDLRLELAPQPESMRADK
jgi:hypothetical protein